MPPCTLWIKFWPSFKIFAGAEHGANWSCITCCMLVAQFLPSACRRRGVTVMIEAAGAPLSAEACRQFPAALALSASLVVGVKGGRSSAGRSPSISRSVIVGEPVRGRSLRRTAISQEGRRLS